MEEEQYNLSAWEIKDDQQSYASTYIKRLQHKIQILNKKLVTTTSKVTTRQHFSNKLQEFYHKKNSQSNLKINHRQTIRHSEEKSYNFKPQSHRSQQLQRDTQIYFHPTQTKQRIHHKPSLTEEIKVIEIAKPMKGNNLSKYTLFSGIKKQKRKKRKIIFENTMFQKPRLRQQNGYISLKTLIASHKLDSQILLKPSITSSLKQREQKIQYKKGLKFPLFYRESNENIQSSQRSKYTSSINTRQIYSLKYQSQFIDDNIFSTKMIRV